MPVQPPLDEGKLQMIRTFPREHLCGSALSDRFDFDRTAQRFTLDAGTPSMHSVIVPKETLDDEEFRFLLNDDVVDALKVAGAVPVTLTTKGPRY